MANYNTSYEFNKLFESYNLGLFFYGCLPSCFDYFENIFGKHPIPVVNEWTELKEVMNRLNGEFYVTDTVGNQVWKVSSELGTAMPISDTAGTHTALPHTL
jgi:hypothetical protein